MKKVNYLDLCILVILLVLGFLAVISIYYKPNTNLENLVVTLRVPAENIESSVYKGKQVYLNGVNVPVEIESVAKNGDKLDISLRSTGVMRGDIYIFNGQRVSINQPAEIHSNFVVKGHIISVTTNEK